MEHPLVSNERAAPPQGGPFRVLRGTLDTSSVYRRHPRSKNQTCVSVCLIGHEGEDEMRP